MEDYLTVKTGEEIFGTIGMRPNAKNNVRLARRGKGWGGPQHPLPQAQRRTWLPSAILDTSA